MAADGQLAQVARYALRRAGIHGQTDCRAQREQVSNSGVRRGRDRARPASAGRRAERHGRDGPYRDLLLFRQGCRFHLRHGFALWTQHASARGVAVPRWRHGADERLPQDLQLLGDADRQHDMPNGRLVPQGDQRSRRHARLEVRVGGFAGRILAKLGVVPQQLAAGDIFPALEKGTIDAAEWVGPYDDEKLGFVKIAKYYYYPGWWEGGAQPHLLVNLANWNELPKIYQSMIQACAREAGAWMTTKYDVLNPQAVKRLVASGAELRPFPQPVMEACYNAANEIYVELARSNPHFKKLLDSLTAYRSDSYQWLQVAELSFDSFMMRMRTRT